MKTKVLMFGWEFPPHNSGGLGVACLGLTRALAEQDVEITFVLPRRVPVSSDAVRILFADNSYSHMSVYPVDSPLSPYVTSEEYDGMLHEVAQGDEYAAVKGRYGRSLFEEVQRYALLARDIAQREQFDIIHAHDWLSFLAGLEAKRVSGKPLIAHVHATEFDRGGGSGVNSDVYTVERRGMEEADCVIAVSNWTKNIITHHYGVDPEKVAVVHNGIEPKEFTELPSQLSELKKDGAKIVLFVGRITLQKGPDYFIALARRVLEFRPDTYFVVSGSGDMERQMIRQAADAGISDKVLFAGFVRGDDLHSIYQAADLYVMPSVSEPFGITPLESLANGTPVLVSRQSGVAEVLTHALKADFWDVEDMTDKVLSVLEHGSLRDMLSVNGKRNAHQNTWHKAAEKCAQVYKNILDKVKRNLLAPFLRSSNPPAEERGSAGKIS